ncbi:MAG: thiamine phosphate synthase [Alphaproteobacteria bacterium]|nr:thiamine phosphate synthase [Alphaproteobacteria bacterium]
MAHDDRLRCRLYLITPPALDPDAFADTLAAALDAGDVASVQLRLKDAADDAILRAGEALMPVAHDRDVAFIVNDRADLARDLGADGVHIGQDDLPYEAARLAVGDDAIVGVTCHNSRHLAMDAAEKGADYVAFGAFFPTETKDPKTKADLDLLRWWQDFMTVPCVAIGGITVDNAKVLVDAGADFLAVVAGVWDYPQGPAAAVEAFNAILDEAHASAGG